MKQYDYSLARTLCTITGIVFVTNAVLELSGVLVRKSGYEWVLPACGVAFFLSVVYCVVLLILNTTSKEDKK